MPLHNIFFCSLYSVEYIFVIFYILQMEHTRKSLRLKKYDYSQTGWYYVTVCTKERGDIFGRVENGEFIENDIGIMINKWWYEISHKFERVELGIHQLMPDHLHGIIIIRDKYNLNFGHNNEGGHIGPPLRNANKQYMNP